ncbi:hypothetical protein MMC30_004310 [Trapelia coarctata]|nr:hypothetical protein [Trapelia coarctata]
MSPTMEIEGDLERKLREAEEQRKADPEEAEQKLREEKKQIEQANEKPNRSTLKEYLGYVGEFWSNCFEVETDSDITTADEQLKYFNHLESLPWVTSFPAFHREEIVRAMAPERPTEISSEDDLRDWLDDPIFDDTMEAKFTINKRSALGVRSDEPRSQAKPSTPPPNDPPLQADQSRLESHSTTWTPGIGRCLTRKKRGDDNPPPVLLAELKSSHKIWYQALTECLRDMHIGRDFVGLLYSNDEAPEGNPAVAAVICEIYTYMIELAAPPSLPLCAPNSTVLLTTTANLSVSEALQVFSSKVTLASHGYTLVAKGIVASLASLLAYERRVYSHLHAVQGKFIPVCLGTVELIRQYIYGIGTYISHMLLLSWAGEKLADQYAAQFDAKYRDHTRCAVRAVVNAGVSHGDLEGCNILWNREVERIMLVDFERATIQKEGKSVVQGVQDSARVQPLGTRDLNEPRRKRKMGEECPAEEGTQVLARLLEPVS